MFIHFWHLFFFPEHQAWYYGATWGNVFAIPACALVTVTAGWLWSKTRYWPLKPIRNGISSLHAKIDDHHKEAMEHHEHQTRLMEEVHFLAHTGQLHPRVDNRIKAKKPITPIKPPSVK